MRLSNCERPHVNSLEQADRRRREDESMIFPHFSRLNDVAFLLLRLMVGAVFLTSGWKHLTDSEKRSKDIGLGKGVTIALGAAECAEVSELSLASCHNWPR